MSKAEGVSNTGSTGLQLVAKRNTCTTRQERHKLESNPSRGLMLPSRKRDNCNNITTHAKVITVNFDPITYISLFTISCIIYRLSQHILLNTVTNTQAGRPRNPSSIPKKGKNRLCGLVVGVPGYRSRGLGSIPGATRFF
jgi:hypothetical protein